MTGQDILLAKSLLEGGKLVGIPTETVYGLAANALNEAAVFQIYQVKNRPFFDPLIIHLHDFEDVYRYVREVPDIFVNMAHDFCPGPITFLLRKNDLISDLLTSGSDLVAVRIPAHPLTSALLGMIDFPLAAPSANPFGYISPTSARHVEKQLGDKLDYILDGGECSVGLESTIVGLDENAENLVIHRKGGLELDVLESYGLPLIVKDVSTSNPTAPGMLLSHYAPRKALYIRGENDVSPLNYSQRTAIVSLVKDDKNPHSFGLSENGDLRQAARSLFATLRMLDEHPEYDAIIADLVPDEGLGKAINDRLRRAAHKS